MQTSRTIHGDTDDKDGRKSAGGQENIVMRSSDLFSSTMSRDKAETVVSDDNLIGAGRANELRSHSLG